MEHAISEIDNEINNPENATNSFKLGELSTQREKIDSEPMELYEKWETLSNA